MHHINHLMYLQLTRSQNAICNKIRFSRPTCLVNVSQVRCIKKNKNEIRLGIALKREWEDYLGYHTTKA